MSLTYFIEKHFNWEAGSVKEFVNQDGKWVLFIDFKPFTPCCVHCHHNKLYIKDYRDQKVLLGHWNSLPIFGSFINEDISAAAAIRLFTSRFPDSDVTNVALTKSYGKSSKPVLN